jgi:hypothetical protein
MREGYDIAQICINGHPINSSSTTYPQYNQDYCDKCGAKATTICVVCRTSIRGSYHHPDIVPNIYIPPSYCYKCGHPFPWTEQKIQVAIELSKEEGQLTDDDVKELEESIKEIISDTPRTQLGASRFKRMMNKLGKPTAQAVRDILVDLVSETAKKIIWPDK